MPSTIQSSGGPQPAGTPLAIDPVFQAIRASIRPLEYTLGGPNGKVLGHYRACVATGTTVSIAAAGVLSYLRWTDPNNYFVLQRLQVASYIAATITTSTPVDVAAYVSRGATAAGSAGNAVTMGGANQKNRALMGSSLVSDFRVATTGALTAPTGRVVDANPFAISPLSATFNLTVAGSATFDVLSTDKSFDLYKWDALGQHPIVLSPGAGESIELQEFTAGPVTGGIRFYFTFEWAEVAVF
jgi:hypothetical protein